MFFLGFGLAFVGVFAWAEPGAPQKNQSSEVWEDRLERSSPEAADRSLTAAVTTALKLSPDLAGYPIRVTTVNRVVTLSGDVRTRSEIRAAQEAAVKTPGVGQVINRIKTNPDVKQLPRRATGDPMADNKAER